MIIRKFEFKDQSTVFDWWNQEGLKKQLSPYSKASEWTQRLLNNKFAFTVEHDNKVIAVFEFLALYQSPFGNIAKVFYFTPFEQAEMFIQEEILKKARELEDYKISQIQFYQWKPILVELWVSQEEEEANVQSTETVSTTRDTATDPATEDVQSTKTLQSSIVTDVRVSPTTSNPEVKPQPNVKRKRRRKQKQPKKESTTILNNNQSGAVPILNT